MTSPARLRRAARRRNRKNRSGCADGPGLVPPPPTSGYRPSRELDRRIRTRDRTCRHFGCSRKAIHADLDHHHPWPRGATSVCNLCCYCRTHHRLKHQAPGWTRELQPDGTLTITTPTGNTRTTLPGHPGGLDPYAAGGINRNPGALRAHPPGIEWPIEAADLHTAVTQPGHNAARASQKPHLPEDDPPRF